jgi:GntR family transcriptional regulator
VVRRQGRGTFVVDQSGPEAASRFDRLRGDGGEPVAWMAKLLHRSSGEATRPEQTRLQIGPRAQVIRKRRLLGVSERPFVVEDACLAADRLPGLKADEVGDWSVTLLAQRHGVHLARAYEEVRVIQAEGEAAALLAIEAGTRLMLLDRIILSIERTPIEWRRAYCHMRDEHYLAEVT